LEQIAKTIFKDHFGNREPNGVLGDVAYVMMGHSPKGSSYNENAIGAAFYQGRAEFGFRFPTRRLFTTSPTQIAEKDDVLLSVRAPVGDLNVAIESCCIGRGLAAIRSKCDNQSFILYTLLASYGQLDIFNGTGTVFGSINREEIENLDVYVPSSDKVSDFERVTRPINKLIESLSNTSERLVSLRNGLLSHLVSEKPPICDSPTRRILDSHDLGCF
jgi:type I restriction enzyme S subunit